MPSISAAVFGITNLKKNEGMRMNSKIRFLIMDVDGTLTDGKIYMGDSGELFKRFDIKDGYGIHTLLPQVGIVPVILTGRASGIVRNRCRELGVENCFQGVLDKAEKIREFAIAHGLAQTEDGVYPEIAYMGDDMIDVPGMRLCGFKGCPADAVREVQELADFISTRKGGEGAAREFIEWMIARQNA